MSEDGKSNEGGTIASLLKRLEKLELEVSKSKEKQTELENKISSESKILNDKIKDVQAEEISKIAFEMINKTRSSFDEQSKNFRQTVSVADISDTKSDTPSTAAGTLDSPPNWLKNIMHFFRHQFVCDEAFRSKYYTKDIQEKVENMEDVKKKKSDKEKIKATARATYTEVKSNRKMMSELENDKKMALENWNKSSSS